jgi:hypothetical protein
MSIGKYLLAASAAFIAFPVFASPSDDALGTCFADSTSPKDRRELAKWVFVAMGTHPDIQDVSRISPAQRDETDHRVGEIVTRLLTQSCAEQMRVAAKEDGAAAFKAAFNALSDLAMKELMINQTVEASLSSWQKYFDQRKFEAAMSPR